jgi:acyl phosphate:glycerol-3-phosphate acyltransferase
MMTELFKWILCLAGAYLVGSIPTAFLVVRLRYGKDLQKYGSGSAGGSNVYRNFSKNLGIAVTLFDLLKGALVIGIASLLKLDTAHQVVMGLAVVVGHNWTVFLRFNGGRGIATSIGVGFFLLPQGAPVFVIITALTLVIHSSPLPLLAAFSTLPLTSWFLNEPLALTLGLLALFLILVIRRLTAPVTERSRKVNTGELLLNRFLFDRDIKDGKAWMQYRAADQAGSKKDNSK